MMKLVPQHKYICKVKSSKILLSIKMTKNMKSLLQEKFWCYKILCKSLHELFNKVTIKITTWKVRETWSDIYNTEMYLVLFASHIVWHLILFVFNQRIFLIFANNTRYFPSISHIVRCDIFFIRILFAEQYQEHHCSYFWSYKTLWNFAAIQIYKL